MPVYFMQAGDDTGPMPRGPHDVGADLPGRGAGARWRDLAEQEAR